jgi:hypothetical protein
MKTSTWCRLILGLLILQLTATAGFCDPEETVGRLGPLTALRVSACLGWAIKIKNDSDVTYTAIYAINDWAGLKVVPPHSTVKAGYVLGQEMPSFHFAPPR